MDPADRFAYLIFYIPILFLFVFLIVKHHSKKDSPWLVTKMMNLQRNKLIYFLSWITVVFSTIILVQYYIPTAIVESFINVLISLLAPLLLIFVPILIMYVGIKSIKEKQTIYYSDYSPQLQRGLNPTIAKGIYAVAWGIIYFWIGLIFFSMIASVVIDISICTPEKTYSYCPYLKLLEIPFALLGHPLSRWLILAIPIIPTVAVLIFDGNKGNKSKSNKKRG